MAAAIRFTGNPAAQKTAEFIDLVNKFFDCLNVTNFDEGKHTRNCHSARRLQTEGCFIFASYIKLIITISVVAGTGLFALFG